MNKKINRLKIETLCITLFQLVIVACFMTLYLLNVWGMNQYVLPEYIIYAFAILMFLDDMYIFRILFAVYKIRQTSDLRTIDVVGNDVNEAYLYGKLGLVVIDDDGIVLWESDFLKMRSINLLNLNIYEWNPKFKDFLLKENDYNLNFQINEYNYSVKFLRNANVFIFKDISEYESLSKYSKEQATCLGIIMIDNYLDIVGNNEDTNDIIAKVKNSIFEYAKEYNVLLRHFKSDAYFAVCNYVSLDAMEKDAFSLLDIIRKIGEKETIKPTLSIGFAHDFPDVNKLNEMASNAIDIAMSRGGDQAVISKYGSDLVFFGGRTEAAEKRNKVRVRVIADSLIGLIDQASNVFIMGHTEMDMDALGSAIGVYEICMARKKPAQIVFDPKATERKTRSALTSQYSREELVKMTISPKEAIDRIKTSTLVVVVDISRPKMTMCPELLNLTKKCVVIDHHRRAEDFIEDPVLSYIEPSASSASELIAEMIKYSSKSQDIKLTPIDATIMLSGIFLDTGFYKSKTVGLRTFEASMILKEYGADNGLADDLLKDDYEEYLLINKIISTMKTPYYGVVYCVGDEEDNLERSTLAKVANQCMQLKGVNAVFVIGKTASDECRISARSDGSVNVQILCEKLGGGGHFTQAATLFKDKTISDVEKLLLNVLASYLNEARSAQGKKGE